MLFRSWVNLHLNEDDTSLSHRGAVTESHSTLHREDSSVYPFIHLPTHPPNYPSIHLSIHPSIHLELVLSRIHFVFCPHIHPLRTRLTVKSHDDNEMSFHYQLLFHPSLVLIKMPTTLNGIFDSPLCNCQLSLLFHASMSLKSPGFVNSFSVSVP